MAGKGGRKKSNQITSSNELEPSINTPSKKQKTVTTSTMSANTTTVATKTLLDDAHDGFKNGNFVCSPLSLDILLGMLAAGAEGETLKQLLGFLGHESVDQLLSESPTSILFSNILSKPRKGGKEDLEFSLVNCIWVDNKVAPVRSSYQKVLETVYKTEARYVDFDNKVKCDEAVRKINKWVHKVTKGLIDTIVNGFGEDDLIVLANALYFKGAWYNPFIAKMTKNKHFYLINGKKVSVPFMTVGRELFDYGSFNGYKIIKLPYKSNDRLNKFSMYIFLPDRNDGLLNLLELFHSDGALFHGDFDLKPEWLSDLWIPKFKISCEFDPNNVMEQMGLTLPFEKTNKELSGIVDMRGLYNNMLYVSKMSQFSYIKVDEKGTVAAACTMGLMAGGGRDPNPISFVADHPFMFMIREDTSRAVLFVGAVLDPSAK
ncbi:serpin-ZX [Artemisia annua]|uniref:Serpin-ZX n=1 Tax=Artemisia annua TaxID=35608 RepID=A0A2U1MC29_ARTAN|nr:serpin-ZX [Artemisia annua]